MRSVFRARVPHVRRRPQAEGLRGILVSPHTLPDLLCLGYRDRLPEFGGAPRRAGAVATVCGAVRIGSAALLGSGSVVRGDEHEVRIGDDFFLGERSTVHACSGPMATSVGGSVTVGANVVLRACRIGDRAVIEDNVVILEGAEVGAGCALEANSLVPAGARLAAGFLYRGQPAAAVRALEPGELALLRGRIRNAPVRAESGAAAGLRSRASVRLHGFVAITAQVEGRLELASEASVWFGARLDGGRHGIRVGAGSNLHDNCSAYAMSSPLEIGADVTVGHNVALQDCRIGDRCLVGSSALVAAGTVIQSDVILAAGSVTLPRQVLHEGWVWGGRPARALEPMTPERRQVVQDWARVVRGWLPGFRQAIADFSDLSPTGGAGPFAPRAALGRAGDLS
jgi:carbonic anhydrase/acetyltransferase-like protein (isoleucine patch superfamily)